MKLRSFIALTLVMLATLIVIGCSRPPTAVEPTQLATESGETLRSLAAKQDMFIGSAVRPRALSDEPLYREVLAREFNIVMAEHVMKFAPLHPEREVYEFRDSDTTVEFAKEHDMQVIGHVLTWFHALPRWLREGDFTREELMGILREHINTVVGRYRGQIYAWDVVNEPLEADGALRETLWYKGIGPEYIDLALRWTKQADPDALLYINDYGEGLNSKSDSFYNLAKNLVERGAPLDAVGFQAHIGFLSAKDAAEVAENMKRYADLGLEVFITEMDVPITMFKGTREEQLAAQAQMYEDFLNVCIEAPNCDTFLMWGFTDRHSWLTSFMGGKSPLIFDEAYHPKPAYHAMMAELKQHVGSGAE